MSTKSEVAQFGNANVDSLRISACKALCKLKNQLVQNVKLLTSNKDKSPIFPVINMTDDENVSIILVSPNVQCLLQSLIC